LGVCNKNQRQKNAQLRNDETLDWRWFQRLHGVKALSIVGADLIGEARDGQASFDRKFVIYPGQNGGVGHRAGVARGRGPEAAKKVDADSKEIGCRDIPGVEIGPGKAEGD
jgi:hypothetical protein